MPLELSSARRIQSFEGLRFRTPHLLALCLLLFAAQLPAAPLRVTTWNLQPNPSLGINGFAQPFQENLMQEAANTLKNLHPDVIILQQVPDRDTCNRLAQFLRPEVYHVVVCSSFRDPTAKTLSRGQVAILAKTRAYISWSEAWEADGDTKPSPGGFAFAAIHLDDKNAGFFSVQLTDAAQPPAREESARQLLQQIATLQNWTTNRLDAFIVAGDFNTTPDDPRLAKETTLSQLEQSGFVNSFAGLPLQRRVTFPGNGLRPDATHDYIFTRDAGLVSGPLIFSVALADHSAVSCDVDLSAPKPAPVLPPPVAGVELPAEEIPAAPAVSLPALVPPRQIFWWLAGIPAVCALFALLRHLTRAKKSRPAALPLLDVKAKSSAGISTSATEQIVIAPPPGNSPYIHIRIVGADRAYSQTQPSRAGRIPEAVREGVIANLSHWLKQKFVRRLISDRAELLATQQAAAQKMLAVDERLTNIERQIQQRNREYEQRIDALLKELVNAREENRELIRAKIAQVKAEMEREKLKTGHRTQEQSQS